MKLYADYQYSMLERPIAADAAAAVKPEPVSAPPAEERPAPEPNPAAAPEPVFPVQQSLLPEEKQQEVTASERQEEEEETVSNKPHRAPQWMNRAETFKREAPEPIQPRFVPQISRVEDEEPEEPEETDISETGIQEAQSAEAANPEESIVISFKCSNGHTAKLTVPDGVSDEEMKLVYDIFNMIMKRRFHVGG